MFQHLYHFFYLHLDNKWNMYCNISMYQLPKPAHFETLFVIVKAKPIRQKELLNFTKRVKTQNRMGISIKLNMKRVAFYQTWSFKPTIEQTSEIYWGSKLASKRKKILENLNFFPNNIKVLRSEAGDFKYSLIHSIIFPICE